MHRGAPTRVAAGSAARSAAASSAARSASRTRCRGATTQTNTPWSWGSSGDATSTARAGPSPSLRARLLCEHARSRRPGRKRQEARRRELKTGHRAPTVRDQHLDRVRIFVRAAAGPEVVRGAGYIPDDFEAPDRRRDEAPARQLPQDGSAPRGSRGGGGRGRAAAGATPARRPFPPRSQTQSRCVAPAVPSATLSGSSSTTRVARPAGCATTQYVSRAERDFSNIRRAPVEHEAALDVALEERVRRDAARDGAGVVGPRDREPGPRPRELLRAQIAVRRLSDDRGAVALLQQRVDARRRRRVALHEDDGQVDRLGRLVSDVDRRW